MKDRFIMKYETLFLFALCIQKDIKLFFQNLRFIRYVKYKILYPSLSIPPSVVIDGKVNLETNVHLGSDIILSGNISVGRNSSLNNDCKLLGDVEVGDNCLLAYNVFASSSKHNFKENPPLPISEQDSQKKLLKKIIIEDDCWIGINVAIMQGVTIGKGSILGSNSVITKNIEPYSIVVGASKNINKRLEFVPSKKIEYNKNSDLPYFYKGFHVRDYEKKRYKVQDGLLTKKSFELKLNIEDEICLIIEVKRFIKDSVLYFGDMVFEIKSNEFFQIEMEINKSSKLSFELSEPILVKSAYLKKDMN